MIGTGTRSMRTRKAVLLGGLAFASLVALPWTLRAQGRRTDLTVTGLPFTVTQTTPADFDAGFVILGTLTFTVDATSNQPSFSPRVTTVNVRCFAPCPSTGTLNASRLQWRRGDLGTDEGGHPGGCRRDLFERTPRRAQERGPQEQILRRVTGDAELGQEQEIGRLRPSLLEPCQHECPVSVEVADGRVDLGQCDSHLVFVFQAKTLSADRGGNRLEGLGVLDR